MGRTVRFCLLGATLASVILCTAGVIELLVTLFFLSHLHALHLILQIIAGINALVSGVMGIVFSRVFADPTRPIRILGIRFSLALNAIIQTVALAFLLLDRAGYADFFTSIFPDHVLPQWTHTSAYLSKGILALSCANSVSLLMCMLIWICTLPCFVLRDHNFSNITITSARWVWKGNDTTFRSPGSTTSFGITPKESKWKIYEPNAGVLESTCDVPDCRPKRKSSFKSYTANNFRNKTGRTPSCRMSSFRPLRDNNMLQNSFTYFGDQMSSSPDTSNISSVSNISSMSRRTPKKILLPTTPPLKPVLSVKPHNSNYVSPDYVPYRQMDPSQGSNKCSGTPNYMPCVHILTQS